MEDTVVERHTGFQTIVMKRTVPENGFFPTSFDSIAGALRSADRDPDIACSLLIGVPGCLPAAAEHNALSDFSGATESLFRALVNARKSVIAAVDGPVIGLGMAMLCHFDVVYATPESVFRAPFVDWGLSPEAASSLLLPQQLGYRKAFEIFCLGVELTADEAERRGFVTRVIERAKLREAAFASAARLAQLPARSLATVRELLHPQRSALLRRARTEAAIVQELLGDASSQMRFKGMAPTTKDNSDA